jgi:hypothetical protein
VKTKSLTVVLIASATLFFASCATTSDSGSNASSDSGSDTTIATSGGNGTGGDNGLACRNYKRKFVNNAQTVVDWTNQAATDEEAAKAFKEIADASYDNSTFLTGEPQQLFSTASTDWKKARIDLLNMGGSADSITAALAAHDEVKNFCNSIGEVIP